MAFSAWCKPGAPVYFLEGSNKFLAVVSSIRVAGNIWVKLAVEDRSAPAGFRNRSAESQKVSPLAPADFDASLPVLEQLAQAAGTELVHTAETLTAIQVEVWARGEFLFRRRMSRKSSVSDICDQVEKCSFCRGFAGADPNYRLLMGEVALSDLSAQPLLDAKEDTVSFTVQRCRPAPDVMLPLASPDLWPVLVSEAGSCILVLQGRMDKNHLEVLEELLAQQGHHIKGLRLGPCEHHEEMRRVAQRLPSDLLEFAQLGPLRSQADRESTKVLLRALPRRVRELDVYDASTSGYLVEAVVKTVERLQDPQRVVVFLDRELLPERNAIRAVLPHGCNLHFWLAN